MGVFHPSWGPGGAGGFAARTPVLSTHLKRTQIISHYAHSVIGLVKEITVVLEYNLGDAKNPLGTQARYWLGQRQANRLYEIGILACKQDIMQA